jgi:hypothetical protein
MSQDVDIFDPVPTQDISARAKAVIVIALCYANENGLEEVSEFILGGLSQRMAETIRDETEDRSSVKTKEGEAAVTALVPGIQGQISAGEISFLIWTTINPEAPHQQLAPALAPEQKPPIWPHQKQVPLGGPVHLTTVRSV